LVDRQVSSALAALLKALDLDGTTRIPRQQGMQRSPAEDVAGQILAEWRKFVEDYS